MPVPDHLAAYTDMLRTGVTQASCVNWTSLCTNAQNLVASILADVKPTPQIEEACSSAVARCCDYADLIGEHGLLYSADDAKSKQARELALLAIEDLGRRLEDARPSERAVALGLGW